MRKVAVVLFASLALSLAVVAGAQDNPFKDVDPNDKHWAYEAVDHLQKAKILIGYPDGYFRGKRTLTRYEFAVALDRLLNNLPQNPGPQGPSGPAGAQGDRGARGERGPQGEPGMTAEELAQLRRLTEEFKNELRDLGNSMTAVNRRLDSMGKDIADIRNTLKQMPKLSFFGFTGLRSDKATGDYVDRDGRFNPITGGSLGPEIVHLFGANVNGLLQGGATYNATLLTGSYRDFLGASNTFAQVKPFSRDAVSETFLSEANISAPFSAIGRGSNITIGRQPIRVSRLTLWKPDTDSYFNLGGFPFIDDGNFMMDGAVLRSSFGSVDAAFFGGLTRTVQTSSGLSVNSPLAGASVDGTIFGLNNPSTGLGPVLKSKPVGQPDIGQMTIDQLAGITLGLNIRQLQGGQIRFTAMNGANAGFEPNFGGARPFTGAGVGFNNVTILGSDLNLRLANQFSFSGEWAKTITSAGRLDNSVGTHFNNAFNANVGFNAGSLNLTAGYKYIDPMFYAPGYWDKIGNWYNPTNIQGPGFRAGYNLREGLGLTVGGDFFSAARGRATVGGLGRDDEINRLLVRLRWDIAKNFNTTVDWEGVYWKIGIPNAGLPGLDAPIHPTEHFIRLGTGYNLTSGTIIRLMYEMGDFDGHLGMTNGAPGLFRSSYNAFTSAVTVHF